MVSSSAPADGALASRGNNERFRVECAARAVAFHIRLHAPVLKQKYKTNIPWSVKLQGIAVLFGFYIFILLFHLSEPIPLFHPPVGAGSRAAAAIEHKRNGKR